MGSHLSQLERGLIFLNKALELFPDYLFDYENYTDRNTGIKAVCSEGHFILAKPNYYLKSHGCVTCSNLKQGNTLEDLIVKSKQKFGDKFLFDSAIYTNAYTKLIITCPIHGDFEIFPLAHLEAKYGCPKCTFDENRSSTEEFIEKSILMHGYVYDYSKVKYIDNKTKVEIICISCNKSFFVRPDVHLYNKTGCPHCHRSKGELKIVSILDRLKIEYEQEKIFKDLKSIKGGYYRFDFYISEFNLLIEFDGPLHFEIANKHFSNKTTTEEKEEYLKYSKEKDLAKTRYCIDNNINLVRIPYWKSTFIESLLEDLPDLKGVYSII